MGEWIVNDDADNRCFGCSPHNPAGLRLRFRHTGPGAVEAPYTASAEQAGAPGVVHGGIQAALLDEVMGMASHVDRHLDPRADAGEAPDDPEARWDVVTADLRLRYRRPVPTGTELRVRARLLRVEGRDYFLEGEIVGPDGEVLTRAESRWRRLEPSTRRQG